MRFSYSSWLFTFAVAIGLFTSLRAQEPDLKQALPADIGVINDVDVTVTDVTEEKLNQPPKREIKFERLTEPLKSMLSKPDLKLFDQKFVGKFELTVPPDSTNFSFSSFPRDETGGVPKLAYLGRVLLVNPDFGIPVRSDSVLEDSFSEMMKALPTADLLAKDEQVFFSSAKKMEGLVDIFATPRNSSRSKVATWQITILGTTPELVEKRAKALLTLLDVGSCRPMQLQIFKKREPLCEKLREQRKAEESAKQMVEVLQNELKSYADFTPDMLSNLRVQQLQLDVDLAGVKARIAACDRLLAGNALKLERRSQVEDLKVAAEIELSGFEARLSKSNEFIVKVKTKVELLSKSINADSQRKDASSRIRGLEREIKAIDAAIRTFAPLPLVDNKIVVQPLEWTQ